MGTLNNTGNPHGYPTRDWCLEAGAFALARKIEAFWADRGLTVSCKVMRSVNKDGSHANANGLVFVVRSNMIGGRPVANTDLLAGVVRP